MPLSESPADGAPGMVSCRKCGSPVTIYSHHVAAGDTVPCGSCGTTNLIPQGVLDAAADPEG